MKIWALKDSRIGSSKQTDFLAKSLSSDVVEKNIEYTKYISIPNFIKPYKVGINFGESDNVLSDKEYPDIIIFAGRRLAGLAIYLKKYIFNKSGKKIKLISILNPNYSFRHFDFVILPRHDGIKKDKYNNIIIINGSLCSSDINSSNFSFWDDILKKYKKPYYSFIIGGGIRKKNMDPNKLANILNLVSKFVKNNNGTLLISTSRRTSEDCIKVINDKNLDCDYYFYKWLKTSTLNPYYYFISKSDIVFLTADSISMISEIVTMHRPIYAYIENDLLTKKHLTFCENLLNQKTIRELNLTTDINSIEKFDFDEINELNFVVNEINRRL